MLDHRRSAANGQRPGVASSSGRADDESHAASRHRIDRHRQELRPGSRQRQRQSCRGARNHSRHVGENGAGKSTLMSILYGFYEADRGEIRVNGEPVRIRSSREAISHGIGMVHQHFMLVPPLRARKRDARRRGWTAACQGRRAIANSLTNLDASMAWPVNSRRDRRRIVGWPPAARRDPEGAGARRGDSRARRADGGADAGRGRPIVRNAARPQARDTNHHLHHPTNCARS